MLGSTAYSSLEALVSHFSSKGNLFFDSNLMLCNPVPPSVPSQPKRVRCKFPYTAAPDTDELSVAFGEILIVHDHPEQDWVWAESIITKKSGSVAYDILEPVDLEEDPFLGYPWFNNERSKGEIVADLSNPKCKSGTFIIRPSESIPPGQEADTNRFYTLFVRSKTQIEKLRIERQQNGRLIFGNRDFDSPIDLFERYAQSEIRPGATLRFPLVIPPASPALPPPKIRLRRLSSSGPRTQKAGWLSVYTTKNAYSDIPNGQWKRYWARLDMDRSKELLTLSLFESEKKNRPKQALQLNPETTGFFKCSTTLFSKEVLAVYQKSSAQFSSWFKFFQFDSSETMLDWICHLEKSMIQANESRVQIRRKFKIHLDGARGLPPKGVDCLICLDEIPVGRTLPQNGPDPRWSILEEFSRISKMPKSVEFIIRKATSGDTIGRVSLSHPNTLEWKQPMTSIQLTSQNEPMSGTVIQFGLESQFRILLPEEEFEQLFELLMTDFTLPCALSTVTANSEFEGSVKSLAAATIRIYRSCRLEMEFCSALLEHELLQNPDPNSLWRGNSFFTSCIEAMIRSSCRPFLVLSLKELVSEISKMAKEPNSNSIEELVSQALCSMNNTADLFPKEVRFVLSKIRDTTAAKWPNQDNLSLRVVANFLFLRFISAGMTSPVSHGLCQQPPTAIGQKVLTKVAKILQSTANFTNSTPMTNRKIGGSDIQSETAELIMRLSNQPENVKLAPNQNRILSLKECRRNPNSDFSSDLDTIFELSLQARPLLSRICSTSQEKKCLAVIEYINQQYNRYKSKLHKCNLLS
jgi:hypothetical protein